MKNLLIIIITCIYLLLSCSSKKDYSSNKEISKEILKATDTLKLSGFVFFSKPNENKFYMVEKPNIFDTIKYIKKLKGKKEDYVFIQPYEAQKQNRYLNYCICNENDSQRFINRIKHKKKLIWAFLNNEEFILLEDKNGRKYLSFKCWKPFVDTRSAKCSN